MHTENLSYKHQQQELLGYLAYDPKHTGKRPAVIVAHDWSGRGEFACGKAEKFAALGYVGFALDMYGEGRVGKTLEEKQAFIKPFIDDRALLQSRMNAALEFIQQHDLVDQNRIVAVGLCFGGLCVLDLARSGANLRGVISVHGLFNAPENLAAKNNRIQAKVLALHGYDDPMVTPDLMVSFMNEMTANGADWQLHAYGNTQHAFSNPNANDRNLGTVYNATADKRSWIAIQNFLSEVFS